MLNRRRLMLLSGATALLVAAPIAALAETPPPKVDNVTAAEIEILRTIDRALDNLQLYQFNDQEVAGAFGMVCHDGTTLMQIRFALHDLVLDWHDADVISNLASVDTIFDGLEKRPGRYSAKFVWLHRARNAAGWSHANMIASGNKTSLRAVATALNTA